MTLADFVSACQAAGVTRVVLRRTAEMRPVTDDDGTTIQAVQRVVLLAYGRGQLFKHEREGTGLDCMPSLSAAAFKVKLTEDHSFRIERS